MNSNKLYRLCSGVFIKQTCNDKDLSYIEILLTPIFFLFAFIKTIFDLIAKHLYKTFAQHSEFEIKSRYEKIETTQIGALFEIIAKIIGFLIAIPLLILVDLASNIWNGTERADKKYKLRFLSPVFITTALAIFFYMTTPTQISLGLLFSLVVLMFAMFASYFDHDYSLNFNAFLFLMKTYIAGFFLYQLMSLNIFSIGVNIALAALLLLIITASAVGLKNFKYFFEFFALMFNGFSKYISAIWQWRAPKKINNVLELFGVIISLPLLLLVLITKLVGIMIDFAKFLIKLTYIFLKKTIKDIAKNFMFMTSGTFNDIFGIKRKEQQYSLNPLAIIGYIAGFIANILLMLSANTAKCFMYGTSNKNHGLKRYQGLILLSISFGLYAYFFINKMSLIASISLFKILLTCFIVGSLIMLCATRKKSSRFVNFLLLMPHLLLSGMIYYSLRVMNMFSNAMNIVITALVFLTIFSLSKGFVNIPSYFASNKLNDSDESNNGGFRLVQNVHGSGNANATQKNH